MIDTDENDTVPSDTILYQYETVCRSGALNMLDRGRRFANTAGMAEFEAAPNDAERYVTILEDYLRKGRPNL